MTFFASVTPTFSVIDTVTCQRPACVGVLVVRMVGSTSSGLCVEISSQVETGMVPPVVASQVKKKSGYLRF